MVVDMPLNSYPAMTTPELLKAKVRHPSPVAWLLPQCVAIIIRIEPQICVNWHIAELEKSSSEGVMKQFVSFHTNEDRSVFRETSHQGCAVGRPGTCQCSQARGAPFALHAAGMRSTALHRPRCQGMMLVPMRYAIHAELPSIYVSCIPCIPHTTDATAFMSSCVIRFFVPWQRAASLDSR